MSAQTDLICQIEILSNAKGFVKYAKETPLLDEFGSSAKWPIAPTEGD